MLHHSARLALVGWLLIGTAATAQVGPEIAYAKGNGSPEIHLINPDGTGDRLLYSAPRGTEIFHVEIRPGGGQLALEEHKTPKRGANPTNSTIKIIDYDANGLMVGSVRTLPLTCLTGSLDYHPTDGTLLYRNCSPQRIYRLNTTTMTPSDLGLMQDAFIASWLDATRILYHVNAMNLAERKLWTVSTTALSAPTDVVGSPPGTLDTSTSGDKALLSPGSDVRLVDVTAKTVEMFQMEAQRGHFSPDDQKVIYITGITFGKQGQFIMIRNFDGSGSPTNLVGRGKFTALDWRN